jgi:hypothetical protein
MRASIVRRRPVVFYLKSSASDVSGRFAERKSVMSNNDRLSWILISALLL